MRVPPSNSRGLSALEISGGILKNDDISAADFHRFISQPASGRSSALPCLAAILVLPEIWRLLRLHGLFFGTEKSSRFERDKFTGYLFAPFVDALTDDRRHIEMRGCRYTAPPLTSTGSVVYRTLRGYCNKF